LVECFGYRLPLLLEIPDYLNDLNACHEMEKMIDPIELTKYKERMRLFYGQAAVFATAAQRCEAFLKTVDKWKEAQK